VSRRETCRVHEVYAAERLEHRCAAVLVDRGHVPRAIMLQPIYGYVLDVIGLKRGLCAVCSSVVDHQYGPRNIKVYNKLKLYNMR
jgi:hypothetical protein